MTQQYDANGFPLPDVPGYGQQNQNFGREIDYHAPRPQSAVADLEAKAAANNAAAASLSADRTPASGKYVYNSATGEYIWVPAGTTAPATAGLSTLQNQNQNQRDGGRGIVESSNPKWDAMTDVEKSAYFQDPENAGMKKIQEMFEKVWGYTTPGMLQNFIDPSIQEKQRAITSGELVRNAQNPVYAGGVGGAYGSGSVGGPGPAGGVGGYYGSGSVGGLNPGELSGLRDATNTASTSGYNGATVSPSGMISGGLNQGPGYGGVSTGPVGGSENTGGGGMSADSGKGDSEGHGDHYAAKGGAIRMASGGIGDLGGYSDGGRLLRGPGDGVSDSIPANIGGKRPARLADGEFVVPARIVSELGNGSTEAGARKLYAMLDRIQAGRKKSIGKGKVATNSRADKNLPA